MAIRYSEAEKEFHLYNDKVSYIMKILCNGELGNLYYGKKITHKEDFSYLLEGGGRSLAVYTKENDYFMSPQYTKMEYPCTGTGDFREPAFSVRQEDGSRINCLKYDSHTIYEGKGKLLGLPAVYVEEKEEAQTLEITMVDSLTQLKCILSYTIFRDYPAIARSVRFENAGTKELVLEKALSASIDLADSSYEMVHLAGAWSRERHVKKRKLTCGTQGIASRAGISSAEHNPFIALKRFDSNEFSGEVLGFSLVYSGNHIEQVEVDSCNLTRVQAGIHPDGFEWLLEPNESFQTPEVIMVYSDQGLNGMSQTYHQLYRTRLARGEWRDKERPILINNWEATGAAFTQEDILKIASTGRDLGMELFVLDDGWFGNREDDKVGLGDWYVTNFTKLPEGIEGLAEKITEMGMKFGLWFEPEMVNKDSVLYRTHPDWLLCVPNRTPSPSRNQYVLDMTREEVIDYLFKAMEKILDNAKISYVKWDMNRYITECYSTVIPAREQGKVLHKYILGVYRLYEKLTTRFPAVLFESCSSGGARFDPGMLYYAPQTWTSDDTDAMERIKIQYGTSYVYPLSSMGAHVSDVPNQQVGRITSLETRANVALFGVFGYELDLHKLSEEEKQLVKEQVSFVKNHRGLIQKGIFYRLRSPFEGNDSAWMVTNQEKKEALVGFYRMSGIPNGPFVRLHLAGLDPNKSYQMDDNKDQIFAGDELMHAGIVIPINALSGGGGDYSSILLHLKEV